MANSRVYRIDPNVFLVTSESGAAQSPADRSAAAWAKILADVNQTPGGYEVVDTTATALDLGVLETQLVISGTMAATLAAPTFKGQRKVIYAKSAASTPALTLTVAAPDDTTGFVCPASFFFDNRGQLLELEATAALKWRCVRKVRTGVVTLTIGTTVTTGICNMSHVDVAGTGTVASTGTKALPDGAAVGELVSVTCSTAASTPHIDLGGTFAKKDGTAGTLLDDFTLVTDNALLQWNGAAWKALVLSGTTLSIA